MEEEVVETESTSSKCTQGRNENPIGECVTNVVFHTKKDIETRGTFAGFLDAVSVYINKPHVVNRRLVGSKLLYMSEIEDDVSRHEAMQNSLISKFSDSGETTPFSENIADVDLNPEKKNCVFVRDLIPKQIDKYPTLREFVYYNKNKKTVTFAPLCRISHSTDMDKEWLETQVEEELEYSFTFTGISDKDKRNKITLEIQRKKDGDSHVTLAWLEQILLVKLARWAEEDKLRTGQTSLRLVKVDEYNKLYHHLKQKYGLKLVEVWPEKTDPQKFVYEDIAIATYLLLIWKEDREIKELTEKQSFVDLGCGNGLLVYILSAEGHPGVGLDLRKRQIWDWFDHSVNLKEEAITPSGETLFPQYDWLIGNHSDELTPWIPVMTARSSYDCCYFVLPCCHHDFDRKFDKRGVGESQYQTYLNFVREVGGVCGFNVEEDTLRIPSTKRVCYIGRSRTYDKSEENSVDAKRTAYINSRCEKGDNSGTPTEKGDDSVVSDSSTNKKRKVVKESGQWSNNFQPRSNKEMVRNCQGVAKETKEKIVKVVFERIMEADDSTKVDTNHGTVWNRGGTMPLSCVAELFSDDVLQQLKSECGGLQTLLRNHNHIFQVTGGVVRLRDLSLENPWGTKKPKQKNKTSKNNPEDYFKTMLCWFHDFHPDGCPRLPGNCKYAHGTTELRPKPEKTS